MFYGLTSSGLVPGLGLGTQSSMGSQSGREDAQANRQIPNSAWSGEEALGLGAQRGGLHFAVLRR